MHQSSTEIALEPNESSIHSIARKYLIEKKPQDSFFLCDLADIIYKHKEWLKAMPRVKPFFSVKSNDDEQVLKLLSALGVGFDCASKNELETIIALGVDVSRIIYANPTKPLHHICAAKDLNITTMTFDNVAELNKIKAVFPTAKLLLRIRCANDKALEPLGLKFGVLPKQAPALLTAAAKLNLNVIGIAFHVGARCFDASAYDSAIESATDVFTVGKEFGFKMTILDIGGGFPDEVGPLFHKITATVNSALDKFLRSHPEVEIIAEPGRYFVATAFHLLTQIHSLRTEWNNSNDPNFLYYINDGVYGSLNCVVNTSMPVVPQILKVVDETLPLYPSTIWGVTCDQFDLVCPEVLLPELDIGDWLIFMDMGAYSRVIACTFNGIPVAPVRYFVKENAWSTVSLMNEKYARISGGSAL